MLQRLAAKTLQGKKRVPITWKTALSDRRTYKVLFCSLALVAVWGTLSYGAIEGDYPRSDSEFDRASEAIRDLSPLSPTAWVPRLFQLTGYAPYLDLAEQDVSTKPANWTGQPEKEKEEMALVTGARLREADLRYAVVRLAFLAKADLVNANLQGANLSGANLQGASLFRAKLQEANFGGANLREADLLIANLQGADFRSFMPGIRETRGLKPDQVKRARNWKLAYYEDHFLPELGLPPDHNETLPQKLDKLVEQAEAAGKE